MVFVFSVVPCFHPLNGFRARGSGPVLFVKPLEIWSSPISVPCGQCIGCKRERSRQWAVRMVHEASMHADNCFLTLTYSPEFLPSDMSLNKRHWQLFAKRMRKACGPFRFFHCGEYGEEFGRPHYHAIIFGYDFPDKVFFSYSGDEKIYTSDLLTSLWGLGQCKVAGVSFESAAYVARYALKKISGDSADRHYSRVHPVTGEEYLLEREYATMSRRPGIARDWFLKFGNEVFPCDEVISRGFSSRPPRYYDSLLSVSEPSVFDSIKRKRLSEISKHAANCTGERLKVRERCAKAKLSLFKRRVE